MYRKSCIPMGSLFMDFTFFHLIIACKKKLPLKVIPGDFSIPVGSSCQSVSVMCTPSNCETGQSETTPGRLLVWLDVPGRGTRNEREEVWIKEPVPLIRGSAGENTRHGIIRLNTPK